MANLVLPQRPFGPNLKSTSVGFGGAALSGESGGYGFGAISEAESEALLFAAYEHGIRLFDTAPIYGFGESERRLGSFFKNHPSCLKDAVVVTKLGVDWDHKQSVFIDNSPEAAKRMLGQSLERLGVSRVDVYMIHWPDPKTEVERTMEALVRLQEEGLFTSIGASNFSPNLIERAEKVAPIDVLQSPMNLMEMAPAQELLPLCSKDRGFMSYATLAKGLLSGTVTHGRTFEASDVRSRSDGIQKRANLLNKEITEFLALAQELGVSGSVLATAWVLSHPGVSTALCGSRKISQVSEIVQAARLELSETNAAKLRQLSDAMHQKISGL